MHNNLNKKNIVITGSTGRLGQHILAAFQPTDATLITVDRAIKPEVIEQYGVEFATQADVTDETSVTACFQRICEEMGIPDAIIHTVGTWDGRPFTEVTLEQWDMLIDLNLTSAFLVFREALRTMDGKPGTLIGISSAQGADRGVAQQAAYSASKGGLTRLIESIAAEYAGTGITAHAIAASAILFDDVPDQQGVKATHLADACLYLVSTPGAALNGATLRAYGA